MKLTDYSEEEIKELMRNGIAKPEVLRDYNILKELIKGFNIMAIAENNRVSERTVIRVKQKYFR